jgi:molybdopterin-binding protein
VINVTKKYTDFTLGPVNFSLNSEDILVIMGATGSGKSTLLNIITGLVKPDSGAIYVNGQDITKLPIESRKIGYLTQLPNLFPHLSVYKNIVFGLSKNSEKNMKSQISSLVKAFELTTLLDRSIDTLSGGEMQKIALARMIVLEPRIMLMDEPLVHLDSKTKVKLRMDLLNILKQRKILGIYVTHSEDDVYALADYVALLQRGLVIKFDSLKSILSSKNISHSPTKSHVFDIFHGDQNYLEGKIVESKSGISIFSVGEHKIEILGEFPIDSIVGILIKPEDIILSLELVKTSARNSIRLLIEKIEYSSSSKSGVIDIQLCSESIHLRSRITVGSKNYLDIKEGKSVYAIFKATTPHVIRKEHPITTANRDDNVHNDTLV